MRQQKLYRVHIGLVDSEGDHSNWSGTNVAAKDAVAAAKKVRLGKGEYVEQVVLLAQIDVE